MKKLSQISFIGLIMILSSCATFKSDRYSEIKTEELQVKTKSDKKIKIYTTWNFNSSVANAFAAQKAKYEHLAMFNDAIKETGCCEIMDVKEGADIVVEGGFRDETNPMVMYLASITGSTLGIIPCYFNAKISISATATKQGKNQTYDLVDSYGYAAWLPLAVIMPFRGNPYKDEQNVITRLYRNLVFEMKKDGVLGK